MPEDMDDVITEDEMEAAIGNGKLGKASDTDDVASELIKYGGLGLSRACKNLFQRICN